MTLERTHSKAAYIAPEVIQDEKFNSLMGVAQERRGRRRCQSVALLHRVAAARRHQGIAPGGGRELHARPAALRRRARRDRRRGQVREAPRVREPGELRGDGDHVRVGPQRGRRVRRRREQQVDLVELLQHAHPPVAHPARGRDRRRDRSPRCRAPAAAARRRRSDRVRRPGAPGAGRWPRRGSGSSRSRWRRPRRAGRRRRRPPQLARARPRRPACSRRWRGRRPRRRTGGQADAQADDLVRRGRPVERGGRRRAGRRGRSRP